jgi:hypothetical protein
MAQLQPIVFRVDAQHLGWWRAPVHIMMSGRDFFIASADSLRCALARALLSWRRARERSMRGMLAPLSPNEESTLRRIALGAAVRHELPAVHVKRLEQLFLVEDVEGFVKLTDLGAKRYATLPRPEKWIGDRVPLVFDGRPTPH